jgi:hypothetical protein
MAKTDSPIGAVVGAAAVFAAFALGMKLWGEKLFGGNGEYGTGYIPPRKLTPEQIEGTVPIGPYEPIKPAPGDPGQPENPLEPSNYPYPEGQNGGFGPEEEAVQWGKTLYEQRAKDLGYTYEGYLAARREVMTKSIDQMSWQELYIFDYNGTIYAAKVNERYYNLVEQSGGSVVGGIVNPPNSWTGSRSDFRHAMYNQAKYEITQEGG